MLLLLTILILLSAAATAAVIAVSVLRKRPEKSLPPGETPLQFQTPPFQYESIFAPSAEEIRALEAEEDEKRRRALREEILAKAEAEKFGALIDAKSFAAGLYDEVLTELTFRCDGEKFASLGSFLAQNNLRTNAAFLKRFQSLHDGNSLTKKDVIRLLHFAALSESAEIFSASLEFVADLLQKGKVKNDFTQTDLFQLAEGEFWLLPPAEKASGAGFLLKQKLAKLRFEAQEKR